jgi:uncharacterized protein YndB with AHSA1/START domain
MTERSVVHASFTIERNYAASPARVFSAWADPNLKQRWFGGGDESVKEYRLDFRVGGREFSAGDGPDGNGSYTYDALYQDIVPNERIVYTYDMHIGGPRISVSLSTVEFRADGANTVLVYTEQGVYLDGLDNPAQREEGTRLLLDALGTVVETETAAAS